MCEPVTIAGVTLTAGQVMAVGAGAVSAISTGLSIMGQQQAANAQADYQVKQAEATNAQIAANQQVAMKSYINQTYATNLSIQEGRDADAAQTYDQQVKRVQAEGAATAAAAEAGVTGNSLNALLLDFHRQEAVFNSRLDRNKVMRESQQTQELKAAGINYENRVTAIKPFVPSPITPPNYSGAAAELASTALNVSSFFNKALKPPTPEQPAP